MRTIHVDFSFTVDNAADDDAIAEWVFDLLTDQPEALYVSADGYDVIRNRRAGSGPIRKGD